MPVPFAANYYMSHVNFGLTANLFKSTFTPFIRGNLGWTFIDSGIPTGNIGTACWWDPWWGYVCSPYAQTYTTTQWHTGYDAGLRFDITDMLFLKGSVGQRYLDLDNTGSEVLTNYRLSIGFMFR